MAHIIERNYSSKSETTLFSGSSIHYCIESAARVPLPLDLQRSWLNHDIEEFHVRSSINFVLSLATGQPDSTKCIVKVSLEVVRLCLEDLIILAKKRNHPTTTEQIVAPLYLSASRDILPRDTFCLPYDALHLLYKIWSPPWEVLPPTRSFLVTFTSYSLRKSLWIHCT